MIGERPASLRTLSIDGVTYSSVVSTYQMCLRVMRLAHGELKLEFLSIGDAAATDSQAPDGPTFKA
jgi:hypothetical protein